MPRKSAATEKKEPASLPEVLIPPSEAAANERSAYWLELIDNPAEFRKAVATEEFWPLLASFPNAFWSDGRLSLYLYRRPSEGLMVKNAEGQRKYVGVLHQPVDEETILKRWGGGKYTLYLKLDSKETLRENTFELDGAPKVLPGQVVEVEGRPVALAAPVAPSAPEVNTGDAVSKVIDASAKANESAMGILAHASETAIDMVKAQATRESAPPRSPLDDVKSLLEIFRLQQPPAGNSMKDALEIVDRLDAMAARRNPAPQTTEPKETPNEEAINFVERLTGKSLPELLKPATRAAVDNEYGWLTPIANAAVAIAQQIPAIIRQAAEARQTEFERQVYLRTMTPAHPGQPVQQPRLPPATPAPAQPGPQIVPTNPTPPSAQLDAGKLLENIITMICTQFDKHMFAGADVAAALAVNYGDQIEAMGLAKTLGNPAEMNIFIEGIPALKQRSTDARWAEFRDDFLGYTQELWGEPGGEVEKPPAA